MVRNFFIILFFATNSIVAQDLIFKKSGETIYCNIESVENYYIHFYELKDTNKQLLYKMDAALVSKIAFVGKGQIPSIDPDNTNSEEFITESYLMVETNIDGIFNDFLSLHFQYLKPKVAFDIGFKRFNSPSNLFFESLDDKGSMFELGISLPMKMFGNKARPLRGLYIRGFGIITSGNFQSIFQQGIITEYNQLSFGVQSVFHYQLSTKSFVKAYFGLGGTIQVDSFGPPTRRADISSGDGLQSIYGFRVGYIF